MARYIQDITLNQPEDFVSFMMNDYLSKSGFETSNWKGEPCFRYGDGMFENYRYIKWSYTNGVFHVEAWLKGFFGKEMGFEGFVASVPKKLYKSEIESLMAALKQPLPEGAHESIKQAAGIQVQPIDQSKNATAGLALGIFSLVISAFVMPLIGIILGVVALGASKKGLNSAKKNQAKIGKICAIIGIVLGIISWILNIMMGAMSIAGM